MSEENIILYYLGELYKEAKALSPGGAVGALIVYFLVQRRQKKQKTEDTISLLKSLKTEITTLWQQHKESLKIERFDNLPKNYFVGVTYTILNDYFTIYHSNADKIGLIKDDFLRSEIIKTYNSAKGLIDTFRTNNSIADEMQTSKDNLDLAHSATRSTLEKKFQEIDEIAKKYSETLINENLELEIMISNLQNNIDKEIKRLS